MTNKKSVQDIKKDYANNKETLDFTKVVEAFKNKELYKNTKTSQSVYSKEKLRQYMKNPSANSGKLCELSRFLYNRSNVYRRLIWFNATMIDLSARTVVPNIDFTKKINEKSVVKSYYQTLNMLDNMNLSLEFLKAYLIAWCEDTFYGCAFYDDSGFFILPLDPKYCQVTGTYMTGDLAFMINMKYFEEHKILLDIAPDPFDKMYKEYEKNKTENQWQEMPDEYAICLKVNIDSVNVSIPPYIALFNSLINLCDLEDIQAVADEQQIYKILIATLPLLKGSKSPDDWALNPAIGLEYFNKLLESLPDCIGAAISPMPIDAISFNQDQSTDVNKIENATKTLFNTSGGAQILNSSTISGSTAWNGAIISDTEYGLSSLLPQTQAYLNRFLSYHLSNPATVKLFRVSPYTKKDFKKQLLEDAQYGLPTKLAINSLNGFSENETLAMNYLEENILHISDLFVPLQSSHTQSNKDVKKKSGGQTKPESDLTDDGEKSIDKRDRTKG